MPKYLNTGTKPVWLKHPRKGMYRLLPGEQATANKAKHPDLKEIKPKK